MTPDEFVRAKALSHVAALEARHGLLPWALIAAGFEIDGQQVLLASKAEGIFRPRQLRDGTLSIRTVLPRAGRERWYDDEIGSSAPHFTYHYNRTKDGPNRDLRTCLTKRLPLIWFYAVEEAVYRPILCRVVGDDASKRVFRLAPLDADTIAADPVARLAALPIERRYAIAEVRKRLHQDKFRGAVMVAYATRCAICALRRGPLLDAAHIIPDGERLGEARVPNGLALCKLHHAAFDAQFLGITPDYEVRLQREVLEERDGPMLEHGLRGFHGQRLRVVPDLPEERPDRGLLEDRWSRFVA